MTTLRWELSPIAFTLAANFAFWLSLNKFHQLLLFVYCTENLFLRNQARFRWKMPKLDQTYKIFSDQGCRTRDRSRSRDRSRDHLQPVSVLVSVSNPRGLGLGLGLEPSWSRSRLIWSRDQQTDRTWNVGSNFHTHKLLQQLKFSFFAHPASPHCPLAIWLLVFGTYWCIRWLCHLLHSIVNVVTHGWPRSRSWSRSRLLPVSVSNPPGLENAGLGLGLGLDKTGRSRSWSRSRSVRSRLQHWYICSFFPLFHCIS